MRNGVHATSISTRISVLKIGRIGMACQFDFRLRCERRPKPQHLMSEGDVDHACTDQW